MHGLGGASGWGCSFHPLERFRCLKCGLPCPKCANRNPARTPGLCVR